MEDDHLVYDKTRIFVLRKGDAYFYSLSVKRESPSFIWGSVRIIHVMTQGRIGWRMVIAHNESHNGNDCQGAKKSLQCEASERVRRFNQLKR